MSNWGKAGFLLRTRSPVLHRIDQRKKVLYMMFTTEMKVTAQRAASFFFGVRIWLVKVLGQFSINYFRGLGLRIRVRVRVSVVIWSG